VIEAIKGVEQDYVDISEMPATFNFMVGELASRISYLPVRARGKTLALTA
jgi:hypothetical protein